MPKFVSLLRGINVSGKKMIKMPELVKVYAGLGFTDVTTYIQSGNVIFTAPAAQGLENAIETQLKDSFGFEVPVVIRSLPHMENIASANPFFQEETTYLSSLYVTFLSEKPTVEAVKSLTVVDAGDDKLMVRDTEVYLLCPKGYGRTKLNNTFLEKKLKVTATTRNWNTVLELIRLMR